MGRMPVVTLRLETASSTCESAFASGTAEVNKTTKLAVIAAAATAVIDWVVIDLNIVTPAASCIGETTSA